MARVYRVQFAGYACCSGAGIRRPRRTEFTCCNTRCDCVDSPTSKDCSWRSGASERVVSLVNDTETALVLVLRDLMGPGADPLEVRLLAIAANTAQRMAVAAWVDGESPAYGDGSPAEVAMRCIRILTAGLGHVST